MNKEIYQFWLENEDNIDAQWQEHIFNTDWGSGEDRIAITEEHFNEFVEELYYANEPNN